MIPITSNYGIYLILILHKYISLKNLQKSFINKIVPKENGKLALSLED